MKINATIRPSQPATLNLGGDLKYAVVRRDRHTGAEEVVALVKKPHYADELRTHRHGEGIYRTEALTS